MFSSESRCPLGNIDSLPPRAESLTMCFVQISTHEFFGCSGPSLSASWMFDLARCCLALYYDASSLVLARGLSPVCSKSALGATNGFLDRPWISDKSAITDRTSQGVE